MRSLKYNKASRMTVYLAINIWSLDRCGGKKTSQKKASQKKILRKKASVNKKASHKFYVKRPQYIKGLNYVIKGVVPISAHILGGAI